MKKAPSRCRKICFRIHGSRRMKGGCDSACTCQKAIHLVSLELMLLLIDQKWKVYHFSAFCSDRPAKASHSEILGPDGLGEV